ncbi:hypothetical protein Ga0061063_0961 [Gulbenkiania indica]|uniref:Uncharacterized protein n=1 Tax=Gulbenkiania indica TaxID=375574 RepID=A0A0K6GTS1_9NEIS|nr:hypothetical protein [Gulbenkiania indica]CUA82106.1 hypothetical protein Ga0061063_0961 [Gulbenkiania indica]
MPTIISNLLLRKLASFPNKSEAIAYARQKLAEGVSGVNVVPRGSVYEVNRPVRVLF